MTNNEYTCIEKKIPSHVSVLAVGSNKILNEMLKYNMGSPHINILIKNVCTIDLSIKYKLKIWAFLFIENILNLIYLF